MTQGNRYKIDNAAMTKANLKFDHRDTENTEKSK